MNTLKRGLIKATDEFVMNNWYDFALVLKDFRITHVEYRHWEGNLWYYYGVSEFFDDIKEGETIPEYTVEFNRIDIKTKSDVNDDFITEYKFIRA